jgi:hypothetical protein
MSSNLVWDATSRHDGDLSTDLKFILRNRYGNPMNATMDAGDIMYLQGMFDAGIKEANVLIVAIRKYGEIKVFEEFL